MQKYSWWIASSVGMVWVIGGELLIKVVVPDVSKMSQDGVYWAFWETEILSLLFSSIGGFWASRFASSHAVSCAIPVGLFATMLAAQVFLPVMMKTGVSLFYIMLTLLRLLAALIGGYLAIKWDT